MKIGLSYSRCVLDIAEGRVSIKDILVIITRTDFDPRDDNQWNGIWQGYTMGGLSNPEWADWAHIEGAEDKFRSISINLWDMGKLHQPRKFGVRPHRLPYYWLEVGLQSEDINSNPAVQKAWEQFQIIAGLANNKTVKDDF
jgi:hypothetical protein